MRDWKAFFLMWNRGHLKYLKKESSWKKESLIHLYKLIYHQGFVVHILHVGAGTGVETLIMAKAIRGGVIIAIDDWKSEKIYASFTALCGREIIKKKIRGKKVNVDAFAKTWQFQVDGLIMGGLDYELLKRRLKKWVAYVKKGGLVVVPEIDVPEVRELFAEVFVGKAILRGSEIVGNVLFARRA